MTGSHRERCRAHRFQGDGAFSSTRRSRFRWIAVAGEVPERVRAGRVAPPAAVSAVTLALLVLTALTAPAPAQVTGSNLLLGQAGNWPPSRTNRGPANRQSVYDQLNLEYVFGQGVAGVRFETDRNSEDQLGYEGLTQRWVDWSDQGYRVRVGNFYTILGRGLVHRSFELTGVVLENSGIRTRFAPSRDVDGVLAEAEKGPLALRLLSGAPSEGTTSLYDEQERDLPRHRGHISGGQVALALWRQSRIGATYQRNSFARPAGDALQQEIGSGFVDIDPLKLAGVESVALPIYAEYAQIDRPFQDVWDLRVQDAVPHALYTGANLIWGPLGLSLEWKDYAGFRLGTNDPPSLVREHSALLLNRATHEEGYQLEASYAPLSWMSLILNRSRSDARFGRRFEEWYGELDAGRDAGAWWEATAFYDQALDQTQSVNRRDTYGGLSTVRILGRWSATLDAQRQTIERRGPNPVTFVTETQHVENVMVSLTGARADRGSLSMLWERTTDFFDPSWEYGRTKPLHLMSWTASARLAERHEAVLFLGKRRGGLACTAGTCYEVQPFEGVELRVLSRF
jgi:hypothetical protein